MALEKKCTIFISDFTGIFLEYSIRSSFSQGLTELGSLAELKINAFSSTLEIVSLFTIISDSFPRCGCDYPYSGTIRVYFRHFVSLPLDALRRLFKLAFYGLVLVP